MSIMIETLYKTDCPEKGKSECYVLVFTPRPASGDRCFSFMEEHGRWDGDVQRFIYEVKRIVTEEDVRCSYQSAPNWNSVASSLNYRMILRARSEAKEGK